MRYFGLTLFLFAFGPLAFGIWGLFTTAGRRRFDEMDGIFPFYALVGGFVLGTAGLLFLIFGKRETKKPQGFEVIMKKTPKP